MDRVKAIDNNIVGVTESVSSAYVPPLQLTVGQPATHRGERRFILYVVRPGRGCGNCCGNGGGAPPGCRG